MDTEFGVPDEWIRAVAADAEAARTALESAAPLAIDGGNARCERAAQRRHFWNDDGRAERPATAVGQSAPRPFNRALPGPARLLGGG
jgi:hypothetical protein